MKVQLIVVRGKPEGKVIPLAGPKFKIGRGETCHLRPNSEQVSREHAEFTIESNAVIVRDLGSRNGTLVNGKALTTEACKLKDRDLVQVGPLTFAVSIQDAPKPRPSGHLRRRPRLHPRQWLRPRPNPRRTMFPPKTSIRGSSATTPTPIGRPAHGCLRRRYAHHHRLQGCPESTRQPSKPPSVADDAEYERQTEAEAAGNPG